MVRNCCLLSCSSTEDLYAELQNSLLALKQSYSNENNSQIVKSQSPAVVQVQQPIAHAIPMETGNNAYIIDVDTYQKLMEVTGSQKSENSIQTEQDITICTLQSEIKQLKEQLYQYELAFNRGLLVNGPRTPTSRTGRGFLRTVTTFHLNQLNNSGLYLMPTLTTILHV